LTNRVAVLLEQEGRAGVGNRPPGRERRRIGFGDAQAGNRGLYPFRVRGLVKVKAQGTTFPKPGVPRGKPRQEKNPGGGNQKPPAVTSLTFVFVFCLGNEGHMFTNSDY
jgi:hypothetical protein